LEKYGITVRPISAGENKTKLSPFEGFKEKDAEWIRKFLGEYQYALKNEILALRGEHFNKVG
jgi:ClpP class serine protease